MGEVTIPSAAVAAEADSRFLTGLGDRFGMTRASSELRFAGCCGGG